jgi:hypothetical protein
VAAGGDPLGDGGHLLGGLARPENDLRPARAGLTRVVDGREAQVFGGVAGQPRPRVGGADLSVAHGLQEGVEVGWAHGRNQKYRGRLTSSAA